MSWVGATLWLGPSRRSSTSVAPKYFAISSGGDVETNRPHTGGHGSCPPDHGQRSSALSGTRGRSWAHSSALPAPDPTPRGTAGRRTSPHQTLEQARVGARAKVKEARRA